MEISTSTPDSETHGKMGAWAPYYDLVMKVLTLGREGALRQLTVDLASVKTGDKVLEVGCGTGTLTLAIQNSVGATGEAHGLDAAPEMIAVARKKSTRAQNAAAFGVGLLEEIPYPDSRFDAVICSFMIFHVSADVRQRGIKEIYRVLKPNGRLLIVEMGKPDFAALRHSMATAGFTDTEDGQRKLFPAPWPMLYLLGVARKG